MGRTIGKCVECGQTKELRAHGRCTKCDKAWRDQKAREDDVLGLMAGRGNRRYTKEQDHLLESTVKIIKTVGAEPGYPEEVAAAIMILMKPFLRDRYESLVPQKYKELESIVSTLVNREGIADALDSDAESTVNTNSGSTVDLEQEPELLTLS